MKSIIISGPNDIFLKGYSDASRKSRIKLFMKWLDVNRFIWNSCDLADYRDFLLEERRLSASTVNSHLSTIRSRYNELIRSNSLRDWLYAKTPVEMPALEKRAFVEEMLIRLKNASDPMNSKVKVSNVQDISDGKYLRLTYQQANTLINAPGKSDLFALRDSAIIALMLGTGIRRAELCDLEVNDLYQTFGDRPALLIRHGKGNKQRMVLYGGLLWCLEYVEAWLSASGITKGAIFRGIYKGGKKLREGKIDTSTVWRVAQKYPLSIDGMAVTVNPHDLRRSYAKLWYISAIDSEVDQQAALLAIQQNLGHARLDETLRYIGTLDASYREPIDWNRAD